MEILKWYPLKQRKQDNISRYSMAEEKIENEPKVEFNYLSDLRIFTVSSAEENEKIFEISGYDLDIRFNRDMLKTSEDVENALDGIKELFRKLLFDDMLRSQNN